MISVATIRIYFGNLWSKIKSILPKLKDFFWDFLFLTLFNLAIFYGTKTFVVWTLIQQIYDYNNEKKIDSLIYIILISILLLHDYLKTIYKTYKIENRKGKSRNYWGYKCFLEVICLGYICRALFQQFDWYRGKLREYRYDCMFRLVQPFFIVMQSILAYSTTSNSQNIDKEIKWQYYIASLCCIIFIFMGTYNYYYDEQKKQNFKSEKIKRKILLVYFLSWEYFAKIGLMTIFIAISKNFGGFFILLGIDILYAFFVTMRDIDVNFWVIMWEIVYIFRSKEDFIFDDGEQTADETRFLTYRDNYKNIQLLTLLVFNTFYYVDFRDSNLMFYTYYVGVYGSVTFFSYCLIRNLYERVGESELINKLRSQKNQGGNRYANLANLIPDNQNLIDQEEYNQLKNDYDRDVNDLQEKIKQLENFAEREREEIKELKSQRQELYDENDKNMEQIRQSTEKLDAAKLENFRQAAEIQIKIDELKKVTQGNILLSEENDRLRDLLPRDLIAGWKYDLSKLQDQQEVSHKRFQDMVKYCQEKDDETMRLHKKILQIQGENKRIQKENIELLASLNLWKDKSNTYQKLMLDLKSQNNIQLDLIEDQKKHIFSLQSSQHQQIQKPQGDDIDIEINQNLRVSKLEQFKKLQGDSEKIDEDEAFNLRAVLSKAFEVKTGREFMNIPKDQTRIVFNRFLPENAQDIRDKLVTVQFMGFVFDGSSPDLLQLITVISAIIQDMSDNLRGLSFRFLNWEKVNSDHFNELVDALKSKSSKLSILEINMKGCKSRELKNCFDILSEGIGYFKQVKQIILDISGEQPVDSNILRNFGKSFAQIEHLKQLDFFVQGRFPDDYGSDNQIQYFMNQMIECKNLKDFNLDLSYQNEHSFSDQALSTLGLYLSKMEKLQILKLSLKRFLTNNMTDLSIVALLSGIKNIKTLQTLILDLGEFDYQFQDCSKQSLFGILNQIQEFQKINEIQIYLQGWKNPNEEYIKNINDMTNKRAEIAIVIHD